MRTEKQIEASRLNGANVANDAPVRPYPRKVPTQRSASGQGLVRLSGKLISPANSEFSTGPRTPEGKARSGRNALKHQLLANAVALPTEHNEEFIELLNDYREALLPVGFLEERVVETITACDWYRRRYWCLGMARVTHAIGLQEQSSDDFTNELSQEIPGLQTALAVSTLADTGRTLEFFRRCDSGYSREYRHARKDLKELQADRLKREQLARLDSAPGLDILSCLENYPEVTDPFAQPLSAKKYSERSEPTEVQSWEPYSPDNDTIAQPLVEDVVQDNAQRIAAAEVRERSSVPLALEKIVKGTEPNIDSNAVCGVTSTVFPFNAVNQADRRSPFGPRDL